MFYRLLVLELKGLFRDIKIDLKFVFKLISLLSIFYIYLVIFYLGYNFEKVTNIYNPKLDFLTYLNSNLLYVFLVGMILLYYFQRSHIVGITKYLHLPIKRDTLIFYALGMTAINFFNLGVLFFMVPFSIRSLVFEYSVTSLSYYLIGILVAQLVLNYIVLFLRNLAAISSIFVVLPILLVLLMIIIGGSFNISFATISNSLFTSLLKENILLIIGMGVLLITLLYFNYVLLKDSGYRLNSDKLILKGATFKLDSIFLKKVFVWYAILELRLISRNKRLKLFFISAMGFLFLFYNILQNNKSNLFLLFTIYIFVSGIFGYILSQYLFSWESSFFDFIISTKFELINYLKAKYIIYIILGFLVFFIFLPLTIKLKLGVHLFFTALMINICFGYFIVFIMASFNNSRIDLNGNIFFNYQGYNIAQFVTVFIIVIAPNLILLLLSLIMNLSNCLFIINLLCIFSLLHWRRWFGIIIDQFNKRKYINLEGYRK